MKRRFAIVAATLALLAIFIAPMGMMGQNSANGGEMTRSSIVLNKDNITNINGGSGYAAYDGDHTIGDVTTVTTSNVMNNSQKLQFKKSGSYLYNKTAMPGNITKITLSDNVNLTIYVGTSSNPNTTTVSSGTAITGSFTYFAVKNATGGALSTTSITVEYSEGGDTPVLETYTVTYKPNGPDASDIEDTYTEGTDVTLRPANTFSYQGYTFSEWNTDESGEGDSYEAGGTIEGIDDDLILFAQWTELAPGDDHTLTFDFEDETAHRTSGSNSYTGTNEYEENGADIILTYADAVGSGSPLSGSYNVLGRIAKNTTNSPVVLIGPIDITNWNITKIEYLTKGVSAMTQVFETSLDGSQWTSQLTLANMPTAATTETVDDLSIEGTELYLRWTVSVASSNGSNRDFNLDDIVITYTESETPAPTIAAENVALDYDATSGSIVYTINNVPTPAGTLSAATTAEWITLPNSFASPIEFTCTANQGGNERTATVTLTYSYGDDQSVSKNVTVTQGANPNYTMTIAEVRAQGTGSVVTKGVVTSCVGTTGYIQDATAAICVYGAELTVGDEIRVSGTLTTYSGLLEITDPQFTVISSGNTVTPAVKTIDQISNDIQGQLVKVEDATVTAINGANTTIAQGSSTIVVRNLNDVAVNDVVTLTANVGCYNNNAQLVNPQDVSVQESTEPSITVSPASVNLTAEEQDGTLDITYANIEISGMEDFDVQFYTVNDGQEQTTSQPSWVDEIIVAEQDSNIGDGYVVSYVINENNSAARTTYFKVFVTVGGTNVYSNLVTINQAEYVAPSIASLPFAFDGGRDDIEETEGLTYEGLGTDYTSQANTTTPLKFDNTGDWLLLQFDERPGTLTFDITGNTFSGSTFKVQTSEDGVTYTDLATYTELGATQNEEFTNLVENVRYIKWIYTNKSSGNVGLGNIVLNKYVAPAEYTLTIGNPDHITITAGYGTDGVLQNEDSEPIMSGTEITLTLTFIEEGYILDALTVVDGNNNPVNYTAVAGYENVWTFNMPNSNVTVNATAVVAPVVTTSTYTLATTVESGKTYIIVGQSNSVFYAMGEQATNNRESVVITVSDDVATVSSDAGVYEFVIEGSNNNGYTIYDEVTPGYLYAASSSKNYLKTQTENTNDGIWTITFNAEGSSANVVANGDNTNKHMQFNQSAHIFSCYGEGNNQHPVNLYVKNETVSYSLDITAYTGDKDHYYLIASPVQSVTPSADNGFLTSAYDLYRFDQVGDAEGNEWLNYEVTPFNLISGQGYLYASSTDTELEFEGAPYMGNGQVTLYKKDCSNASGNFEGWNLVGNPFAQTAYIDRDCYVMNENRNQIVAGTSREVAAMEGVFVIAASDGETMTFSTTAPGKADSKVVMNVIDNQGVADRAIVRFGEGSQLPKFQLKGNSTKVYFQQGQEEFAIVAAENEGELPVNFKASRNGRYTMSFDVENLDMNYLHLIDNKTGNDVDLLATPSYTFQANSSDYESRFRLVFDANAVNENNTTTTFAYFNGTEWVVNNNGNATLQVIDMMGRVLSSQTISGNANVNINQAAGIYMLRLVNGENVMVQKVVVR